MYDVIIIGAGPAGISAGIYAKRSNLKVLIFNYGKSELEKAHKIDNYYGFSNGITGRELFNNGINQAKNLDIEIINEEIIDIENINDIFKVKSINKIYNSKSVIIATGSKKEQPKISNIDKYIGKGLSYCAICDGFFFKNKNVCVIGNGNYALNEANYLKSIVNKVTILTNNKDNNLNTNIEINTKEIDSIIGENIIEGIKFTDNSILKVDGIFIAIGEANGVDFANKLGIVLNNNNIEVNQNMETNIKGIYACGNITCGLLQVNKSVYEGALAAISCIKYIKNK